LAGLKRQFFAPAGKAVRRWAVAFRAWRDENAKAHAEGRAPACCSAPPAGATARSGKKA